MSKVEGGGGGECPIDLPSRLRVTVLSSRLLGLNIRDPCINTLIR